LRSIWYPTIGHFNHLRPEWEVRDLNNGFRYIDFAYMPGHARGAIEVQGYSTHARDIEVWRFKDLCVRHCLMELDNWLVMPIAYPSIIDDPRICQQIILSFVGKFLSAEVPAHMSWLEAETIRFARRLLRPFTATEVAAHLRICNKHARNILRTLATNHDLAIVSGTKRIRTYQLTF
jgi:hypothetical protein